MKRMEPALTRPAPPGVPLDALTRRSWLTFCTKRIAGRSVSVEEAHAMVRDIARQHDVTPLRVTVFTNLPFEDTSLLRREVPTLWVRNQNGDRGSAYFHLEMMASARQRTDLAVEYVRLDDRVVGAKVSGDRLGTLLLVSDVSLESGTFAHQSGRVWAAWERILAAHRMHPSQIFRTWFFIDAIGDNYRSLNAIRDSTFDAWALRRYPASTGVGARMAGPAAIASAFWAYDRIDAGAFSCLSSRKQCEAYAYGPRFARASMVALDDVLLLSISGTSAIDRDGRSCYAEDVRKHIELALECAHDLLERSGLSWKEVASAYVYCKDERVLDELIAIHGEQRLDLPYIYNLCDICRPDLLFEIECIALAPHAGRGRA